MVGKLGFSKSSPARDPRHSLAIPPPPYDDDREPSPILLAETVTTVTTTTQTTTHFFSFPLWSRKRQTPPSTRSVNEIGIMASNSLRIEKELPPTPDDTLSSSSRIPSAEDLRSRTESSSTAEGSSRNLPVPAISIPSSQPVYALAHASLGIGLPHVIPRASTSSGLDVNTVAFLAHPQSPDSRPSTTIRKSKSSQRIKISSSSQRPAEIKHEEHLASRRARGISLGPGTLLHFGSDSKGKGKDLASAPPSTVTRRPSFWSRRKAATNADTLSLPVTPLALEKPSLPNVPPVSPFNVDIRASPQGSQAEAPADLPRGRLERATSFSSASTRHHDALSITSNNAETAGKTSRRPRRPATADPYAPSHTRSFFSDPSRPILPSPPPISTTFKELPEVHAPSALPIAPPPVTFSRSARPRSQTNPPLLHRLSINFFSSSVSPTSNSANGIFGHSLNSSPVGSSTNSPRQSLHRPPLEIPKPQTDAESPEIYLNRLLAAVSKAEVAGILASSGDSFYTRALRSYIGRFNFDDDPLDVALRKLLMDVGLPRETQQIDRVIEAFAYRYLHCNPNLFTSEDHPYILAFSLIMLHTDAFNKSNKRKMTKPDYIKNTKLPGVVPEVLDYFYDNIVFAPFIFIEDPLDIDGQRGVIPESTARKLSTIGSSSISPVSGSSGTLLGKSNKIDPYFLITNDLLDPLRVDVDSQVPRESPYLHEGTGGPWNEEDIRRSFAKASIIEVGTVDSGRMTSPFFGLSVSGVPSPLGIGSFQEIPPSTGEALSLRLTKVGLLNRKDEVLEGGKKASSRKWRTWSVILTGSQLLLFRDPAWATALLARSESPTAPVAFPQSSVFKPDELMSVKDAIAVFDKSYTKYENTLRFVLPDGRHILFQADGAKELNEWISHINYASSFKTTGVRMRALGMSGRDLELTGLAAATSHLHDKQHAQHPTLSHVHSWDGQAPHVLMDMLTTPPDSPNKRPVTRRITVMSGRDDMEMEAPVAPEIEGAYLFKATFDQVKAELAAGHWTPSEEPSPIFEDKPSDIDKSQTSLTTISNAADDPQLLSRSRIVQSKIHDLEAKIVTVQSQLDADLRFVRNIATLTPFQRSTRDRLQAAVQNISKRIIQTRLSMAKLVCHRQVLSNDLIAEERDWFQAKETALKAATESLQSRSIPQMTVQIPEDKSKGLLPITSQDVDTASHKAESSICESFHSALDFGPEWPSSDDLTSADFLNSSLILGPLSAESKNSSRGSFPFSDAVLDLSLRRDSVSSQKQPSSVDIHESSTHDKLHTLDILDEQAEEWNKTRAAKRVSLVRMPSTLAMLRGPHCGDYHRTVLEEVGMSP